MMTVCVHKTVSGIFSLLFFASMFVERMEVLDYRKKFEVKASTFPGSLNKIKGKVVIKKGPSFISVARLAE